MSVKRYDRVRIWGRIVRQKGRDGRGGDGRGGWYEQVVVTT